jgi:UDP-N-acetyl-2-amino-2-deoxyglucuronate dehydrogenase
LESPTVTTQPIRIAIIGTGVIGELHADVLSRSDDFAVTAVVNRSLPKAEQLATRVESSGSPRPMVVTDLGDALECCDAVSICTPSGAHGELGLRSIAAGKHTMIEKPIDVSLESALRIQRAAADRPDVITTIVSQHRYDPSCEVLFNAVQNGRLGRLTSGVANLAWWRSQAYYDTASWRGTWQHDGGGALMNQGIHLLDLMLWMMGPVATVQAQAATLAHSGIEVEDTLGATLLFESGAIGSVLATTAAYPELSARLQVHGDRGSAVIDDYRLGYFHTSTEDRTGSRHDSSGGENLADTEMVRYEGFAGVAMGDSHARQYADFARGIRDGRQTRVPVAEAVRTLAVIEAVYEAARSGRAVSPSGCTDERGADRNR